MCSFRHLIVMVMSSDSGRNLIGRRTESDRVANGIRSGGGRKLIGRRTETDRAAGAFKGVHLSPLGFAACQSKKCTNKAILILLLFCWCSSCLLGWCTSCSGKRQSRAETSAPPKKTQRNRNNIAAGHTVMSSGYTLLYIGGFKGVHLSQVHQQNC